jgi:hypothetical protein
MKRILSIIVIASFLISASSQSRKEQIEKLTFTLDSINRSIGEERINHNLKTNDLLATINKQKEEISSFNSLLALRNTQLTATQELVDRLKNEIEKMNTSIDLKKKEIEALKAQPSLDYLITNNSVGLFKLGGSWRCLAQNHYSYNYIQTVGTCVDACCDGGFALGNNSVINENGFVEKQEITIGAEVFKEVNHEDEVIERNKHKNNKDVFFTASDNCLGLYWNDKIRYFVIYSPLYKTKEGIGVGMTLEKLKEVCGDFDINIGWVEEDVNAITGLTPYSLDCFN